MKKLLRAWLLFCTICVVVGTAEASTAPQMIELQLGEPIDLRQFGGPNINFSVVSIDISDVTVRLQDYDRTQISGGGSEYTGYYSVSSTPTSSRRSVKKANGAVLFRWRHGAVAYVSDTQNRVSLAIVTE